MKNVHRISTKQHGSIKSGISISQSQNSTISQAVYAGELSCWKVRKLSYLHNCVKVIVLGIFCSYNSKTSINLIKFAIRAGQLFSKSVSTGCNKPVCTHSTLWRQHCVTISKEYL